MTLGEHTQALKASGRKALVPFFTAGYPDDATFVDVVKAAADAGADVIEIGIPFSDPIADGPVIQASSTAALARGMTLARAIGLAKELSQDVSTPLVIMSYINPILTYGLERFVNAAKGAGILGTILPDVSFEESHALRNAFHDVEYIDLLAPTSSDERIEMIAANTRGFLYLVSLTGVTGARGSLPGSLPAFVARVRPHTDTPLYVGFGVSTPEHAATVVETADGVIIGSRLIRLMDEAGAGKSARRVGDFLTSIRAAIDA